MPDRPAVRPGTPTTQAEYGQYPGVNYSTLKYMAKSPLHYRYACDHPVPETPAMLLGRATHTAVFEPDRFPLEYEVWPERRQGRAWDEFRAAAESAGKSVLTTSEYETALAIRDSVRGQSAAARLLSKGRPEVMLTWTNRETGLECKGRLDWIAAIGCIVDLKTTNDISPRIFAAHAWRMGYFHQAAMYQEAYYQTTGGNHGGIVLPYSIIAVESSAPFACTIYELPPESIAAAWDQYVGWLRAVAECRQSGIWPGPAESAILAAPAWAITEAEADVDFGGVE